MSAKLKAEIALRVVEQASWEKVTLVGRSRSFRSLTFKCRRMRFLAPRRRRARLAIGEDVGHHRKEQRRADEGELEGRSGRHIGGGSADGFGPSS